MEADPGQGHPQDAVHALCSPRPRSQHTASSLSTPLCHSTQLAFAKTWTGKLSEALGRAELALWEDELSKVPAKEESEKEMLGMFADLKQEEESKLQEAVDALGEAATEDEKAYKTLEFKYQSATAALQKIEEKVVEIKTYRMVPKPEPVRILQAFLYSLEVTEDKFIEPATKKVSCPPPKSRSGWKHTESKARLLGVSPKSRSGWKQKSKIGCRPSARAITPLCYTAWTRLHPVTRFLISARHTPKVNWDKMRKLFDTDLMSNKLAYYDPADESITYAKYARVDALKELLGEITYETAADPASGMPPLFVALVDWVLKAVAVREAAVAKREAEAAAAAEE